jgi:hypothetical protein
LGEDAVKNLLVVVLVLVNSSVIVWKSCVCLSLCLVGVLMCSSSAKSDSKNEAGGNLAGEDVAGVTLVLVAGENVAGVTGVLLCGLLLLW